MLRIQKALRTGLLILILAAPALYSQTDVVKDSTRYVLTIDNGERYAGYVLGRRNDTLRFLTLGGASIATPVARVFELERSTATFGTSEPYKMDPLPMPPNHPSSNLFLMPTAYTIPEGEVHAGLYEIFVAGVSVGAGGFADISFATLIPGFSEIYMLSAKLSPLQTDEGALAIGGVIGGMYEEDDPLALLYAVGTLALGKSWLSLGCTAFNLSENGEGLIMLGLDAPVASRARVIAELWIPTADGAYVFAGVGGRFESKQFWLDIGLYFPLTDQTGYGSFASNPNWIPYLGGTFVL